MISVEAEETWRMPVVQGRSTALGIEGEEPEIFEAPAASSALPELMAAKDKTRGNMGALS